MSDQDDSGTARKWRLLALESLCAFGAAALLTLLCTNIQVDPVVRMGQVSGLASMQVRVMFVAALIIGGVAFAARWRGGTHYSLASRLACAAASGLASGLFAGGILVALRGSDYGLNAQHGDSGVLAGWADDVLAGGGVPSPYYPPLQVWMLAGITWLQGVESIVALKTFNTIGLIAVGPGAYLAWRLWLRPPWALAVAGLATLPMMEAYRPWPLLVLVVFVPIITRLLHTIRRAYEYDTKQLMQRGVAFGGGLGLMFVMYSGWFHWSAYGVVIAALALAPWRKAPRKVILLGAVTGIAFALIAGHYLYGVLTAPPISDDFHYFDSRSDPAYVAMWRGDSPGQHTELGTWPPWGELGGVGIFTALLAVGAAFALALGRTHSLIAGLGALLASAWFMRFWTAHYMFKTKLVQLYPRTTPQVLYVLLVLCVLAVMWAVERFQTRAPPDSPLVTKWGQLAAMIAIMFVGSQAASHLTDRYMPNPEHGYHGELAWNSHRETRGYSKADGSKVTSSSIESDALDRSHVVDGNPTTFISSQTHPTASAEEWITLDLPIHYLWHRVAITPANDGWPENFTIEVWNGTEWLTRWTGVGVKKPKDKLWIWWGRPDRTPRVRLHATRLGKVEGGYALRIADIGLYD